jgi:hypothetical protein
MWDERDIAQGSEITFFLDSKMIPLAFNSTYPMSFLLFMIIYRLSWFSSSVLVFIFYCRGIYCSPRASVRFNIFFIFDLAEAIFIEFQLSFIDFPCLLLFPLSLSLINLGSIQKRAIHEFLWISLRIFINTMMIKLEGRKWPWPLCYALSNAEY